MWSRVAAVGVLITAAWPALAQVKLDGFLDGIIENACEGSGDFQKFKDSLRSRYDVRLPEPRARVFIPDGVRSAIGKARVTEEKSDYRVVTVPLSGMFRGLSVSQIGFAFGIETGVQVTFIVFSSPIGEVQRVLGPAVASGRDLSDEYGGLLQIVVKPIDGRPNLICDRST